MKFLLVLLSSFCFCKLVRMESVLFENYVVLRLVPEDNEDVEIAKELETNLGVIVLRQPGKVGQPMDVALPPHLQTDFMKALQRQMPSSIMTDNLESMINRESMEEAMEMEASTEAFEAVFTTYMPIGTLDNYLIQMQKLHPNLMEMSTYGKSFEGRDLQLVKISENNTSSTNKHVMFMDCGTHAREWITVMECADFIRQLCETPQGNELLKSYDFFVAPLVNPDGYAFSWASNRLWRKTRMPTGSTTGCRGVDPNRNYPFGHSGEGSSADTCSDVYHGGFPLSAPETNALSVILQSIKPLCYITMHSYSQMILLAYGCAVPQKTNENFAEQLRVANRAKSALQAVSGTEYKTGNSRVVLYEACGDSQDWVLAEELAKYAYTYELRDTGTFGFLLPEDQIQPTCIETTASVFEMCKSMLETNPI